MKNSSRVVARMPSIGSIDRSIDSNARFDVKEREIPPTTFQVTQLIRVDKGVGSLTERPLRFAEVRAHRPQCFD